MPEPAPKRRRVAADHATTPMTQHTPIVHSKNFWLDDGNIILQAETQQFRVHRSMLARHSSIFEDMFAMPQPAEPQDPIVEGSPVITLSDSPVDVQEMLSIFYDGATALDQSRSLPIFRIESMLRIGMKYEIAFLRDEALLRLRREFPSTLDEWYASFREHHDPAIDHSNSFELAEVAISLGREHDIPTTLPGAFLYYVSLTEPEKIAKGEESELPQDVRAQCMLGRDKLLREIHTILQSWTTLPTFMPSEACHRSVDCRDGQKERILAVLNSVLWPQEYGLLWEMHPDFPGPVIGAINSLCESCAESVKVCYNNARQELWAHLPGFFGLPPWSELKDFDQ